MPYFPLFLGKDVVRNRFNTVHHEILVFSKHWSFIFEGRWFVPASTCRDCGWGYWVPPPLKSNTAHKNRLIIPSNGSLLLYTLNNPGTRAPGASDILNLKICGHGNDVSQLLGTFLVRIFLIYNESKIRKCLSSYDGHNFSLPWSFIDSIKHKHKEFSSNSTLRLTYNIHNVKYSSHFANLPPWPRTRNDDSV